MCRLFITLLAFLALTGPVHAKVIVEVVEYTHAGTAYRGYLAFDEAIEGKRPGVLVCHEWWGCNDYARGRAMKLAELGYVAFALDMYGKDKVTSDPSQASQWAGALYADPAAVEISRAGLDVLRAHRLVDAERLAAIGYCMGGTVALELARTGAPLAAIVAFHTSTLAAKDPSTNENIRGSVLICHGADDTFVKPEEIDGFQTQMREAKVDFQFVAYSGAVHSFTNPAAGAFRIPGVAYHARADARSWDHMRRLFDEVFADGH